MTKRPLTPLPPLAGSATTSDDEDLWDVRRASKHLGMSTHWTYRAVAAGTLPHRKIGAAVRFVPGEIRAWLDNQRGKPK